MRPLLQWQSVPVNAALFPASRDESLAIARGSFRLVACTTCGLLFNADHDERLAEYSTRCIETQECSPHHQAFTNELAAEWVERHGLAGEPVVEVGAGHRADFFRRLLELGVSGGTCVDPACEATPTERLHVRRERFTAAHASLPGRALVCRHTLEHIPDVREFLRHVRTWALSNAGGILLFEVPDTERILEQGAFWDMYYEHCSYFSRTTLAIAFRAAGLVPTDVRLVYDGQYILLEARAGDALRPDPAAVAPFLRAASAFADVAVQRIESAARALRDLSADGGLFLWQAGGKALSLVTLTDTAALVQGVVDVNPEKRGRFLPGTAVAIVAPHDLERLCPRHVVVMNDVYLPEIGAMVASLGLQTSVRSVEALFD